MSARPAVIELFDDRFVLSTFDRETGTKGAAVMDVDLSDLRVRGSGSTLLFVASGDRKRVDFSLGARAAAGLGIPGLVAANALIARSGIREWVSVLKTRGVSTRYLSFAKVIGWSLVGLVALVGVFVVLALTLGSSN